MVSINPGGVMGPTLTGVLTGQSMTMINDMINGKLPGIPDIALGMADVRDVAEMHVAAITAPKAPGERFIVASEKPISMMHVAQTLKDSGYSKVSTRKVPKFLVQVLALFDKDAKGMLSFIGKKVNCDNQMTKDILGWSPTPIEKSLLDMAKSIHN